jgi:hypothetical protein
MSEAEDHTSFVFRQNLDGAEDVDDEDERENTCQRKHSGASRRGLVVDGV